MIAPQQNGVAQSSPQNDKTGPRYGEQQVEVDFPLPATAAGNMYNVLVQTADGTAQTYPSLAYVPSVSNVDAAAVRATYAGRTVYVLGGAALHCMHVQQAGVQVDFSMSPLSAVRVVAANRSEGTAQVFSLAGSNRSS